MQAGNGATDRGPKRSCMPMGGVAAMWKAAIRQAAAPCVHFQKGTETGREVGNPLRGQHVDRLQLIRVASVLWFVVSNMDPTQTTSASARRAVPRPIRRLVRNLKPRPDRDAFVETLVTYGMISLVTLTLVSFAAPTHASHVQQAPYYAAGIAHTGLGVEGASLVYGAPFYGGAWFVTHAGSQNFAVTVLDYAFLPAVFACDAFLTSYNGMGPQGTWAADGCSAGCGPNLLKQLSPSSRNITVFVPAHYMELDTLEICLGSYGWLYAIDW